MSNTDPYAIIFSRRHPQIKDKIDVWQLINDSYYGGTSYKKGDYLFKHAKESLKSFAIRKERAVYFNQIQPLADLLAGFLFIKPPSRVNIDGMDWLIDRATDKKTNLNEFMKTVAIHSVLFTCGVLVDSPTFDPEVIRTEKDRQDNGLNPFCTLYLPFQIRDFYIGEDGALDWVLLDNSYYDNRNPLEEGTDVVIYRLWTREAYQDFELMVDKQQGKSVKVHPAVPHSVGSVPFRFVNWKDDNNDFISESVFEDPAMISRLIYNKLSEMDEMIAAGSFKVLMYPTADGTLPSSLTAGGIGSLSAIPYEKDSSKAPTFDGAKLEDVGPFLKAMEFYISEILKKIGLDTDETKDYVKSGLAKKIDFQKVRTLLVSGSTALAGLETWIFNTARAWQGDKESKIVIHYTTHYAEEDIQVKVDLLTQLLVLPFTKLKKAVASIMVKNLLTGELPAGELEEIYNEIAADEQGQFEIDVKALAEDEQAADNKPEDGSESTNPEDNNNNGE